MNPYRGPSLLAFTLAALLVPGVARAATASCMSPDGACTVSNDGFDWLDCNCADGSGIGGGGGNEWAGLTEPELVPICEEQIAQFCGPFIPPDYVECGSSFGYCMIDNEPEDELQCECWDGSAPGSIGGMAWAGWDDVMLYAECEVQLDALCPPPEGLTCSNGNGECLIANVPNDFLACECVGGFGDLYAGGSAWASYDELQLHNECATNLVALCGGPLPSPPWQVCSSSLGECTIDNDPEDRLECTCADGEAISSVGGSTWADLSDDELFAECEEQLYQGCSASGDSSGTDTGDTGDGSSSGTPADDSTGTPLDGSTGTPPPVDPSDGSTGTPSDGSSGDGGAADGGGSGGCSCSADGRSSAGGWALALLGLVGLGRRRRIPRRVREDFAPSRK